MVKWFKESHAKDLKKLAADLKREDEEKTGTDDLVNTESTRKVIRAYVIFRVTHQTYEDPDSRKSNGGTEGVVYTVNPSVSSVPTIANRAFHLTNFSRTEPSGIVTAMYLRLNTSLARRNLSPCVSISLEDCEARRRT